MNVREKKEFFDTLIEEATTLKEVTEKNLKLAKEEKDEKYENALRSLVTGEENGIHSVLNVLEGLKVISNEEVENFWEKYEKLG